MKKFTSLNKLQAHLRQLADKGIKTGFVPTMGALHQGHLSLIEQAKMEVDQVICSIFVNPLQFNRSEDLKNYPQREEEDIQLLNSVDCDLLFVPHHEEIYPDQPNFNFNFGSIGKGMEAEYRPGHFEGVAAVIHQFLKLLQPDRAYFGEKDYQQLAIVKWLVKQYNFKTKIIGCPTKRAENGLALSSRNYLLNPAELEQAGEIYQSFTLALEKSSSMDPDSICRLCREKLEEKGFEVEYFTIVDENSMKAIKSWEDSNSPRAFVAANLSGVRLIDNLSLIS